MQMLFHNSDDKAYQASLNKLLKDIFLDFQFWYDLDLWDENYGSYSYVQRGEIISNICVYKMEILYGGQPHWALSVGAVATREDYRGQGLARKLMERIIDRYPQTPMYLSANHQVVDFYPRFGFRRVYEKLPVYNFALNNQLEPVRRNYTDPVIWRYLSERVNFSKALDCLNAAPINMFDLHAGYLQQHIYEIPELETLVVAAQEGKALHLFSVFSLRPICFAELASRLPFTGVERIEFGFMPPWPGLTVTMEETTTDPLFVRSIECDLGDFKFPELSFT